MNRHQEHLLGLIKEIDQICRKHDIRYYSAGGTVIGGIGVSGGTEEQDTFLAEYGLKLFKEAIAKK